VPLGERGDLAPQVARHRGDKVLHRAAAAHGLDDKLRLAGTLIVAEGYCEVPHIRTGEGGAGYRSESSDLATVVELLLRERRRPAELLDNTSHTAARRTGVGVGRSRGHRDAAAARQADDGLDLTPAMDER
jgi:hypothetical protein